MGRVRNRLSLLAALALAVAGCDGAIGSTSDAPAPDSGSPADGPETADRAEPPDAPPPSDASAPADTLSPDAGPDPWGVPFLGRTASAPISLSDCADVTITGLQFVDVGDIAVSIESCDNVTVTGNDFANVVGAIYALNSTNVTVTWNRYENLGDGTIGSGHSNFVQLNNTIGGYIGHNKGIGGNSEDIVSVFQSGGPDAAHPLVIEHNAFEGTDWVSSSGSGMMLGDAGGAHIVARFNTLLTPGQVGFGVASGTDIHVTDNTIYGAQRTGANVGIYVWNQYPSACAEIEVARNLVRWYRADGAENPFWDGANCGAVAGESTNDWHADLDPATLHVGL